MVVAKQDKVDGLINVGGYRLKGNELVVKAEEILLQNIESALFRLGLRLADNLEMNAPMGATGKLKSTFGQPVIRETKTGYSIEIKTDAYYFDYIDKGVRGVDHELKNKKVYPNAKGKFYQFETYFMPPKALKELEGWMQRKNIEVEARNMRISAGDEKLRGRRMLPQISSSAQRMAYYIKKYGIAGTNFIQKSIDQAKPEFDIDIQTIGADSLVLKVRK
jgi:hypothetical protein